MVGVDYCPLMLASKQVLSNRQASSQEKAKGAWIDSQVRASEPGCIYFAAGLLDPQLQTVAVLI